MNYRSDIVKVVIVICVALLCAIKNSYAQGDVLVILSNNSRIYNQFRTSIIRKLEHATIIYSNNINKESFDGYKLIVVSGTNAANSIRNYKFNTPVLYSLIPRDFYTTIINNNVCPGSSCYAVYIEQPASKYIRMVKTVFGTAVTIAIPVTRSSHHDMKHISLTADQLGMAIKKIYVEKNDNIPRLLSESLKTKDVLLALPDPEIYNKNTARSILLTSYHNNVPIISYSQAFVKAGALAGLYSSIENISSQTASLARRIINGSKPVTKGYYPNEYSVEINKAVARSLNIDISPPETIKRKMQR